MLCKKELGVLSKFYVYIYQMYSDNIVKNSRFYIIELCLKSSNLKAKDSNLKAKSSVYFKANSSKDKS